VNADPFAAPSLQCSNPRESHKYGGPAIPAPPMRLPPTPRTVRVPRPRRSPRLGSSI